MPVAAACAMLMLACCSAFAADDCGVYRQDANAATGWNQNLPVAEADAAVADLSHFPFLDHTMNGKTVRYITTEAGTGVRTRTAHVEGQTATLWYATYDVTSRVADGQPNHFLIIDGELFWPDCLP